MLTIVMISQWIKITTRLVDGYSQKFMLCIAHNKIRAKVKNNKLYVIVRIVINLSVVNLITISNLLFVKEIYSYSLKYYIGKYQGDHLVTQLKINVLG